MFRTLIPLRTVIVCLTASSPRERGAQVSDEEPERLVEWLGRVWETNQDN